MKNIAKKLANLVLGFALVLGVGISVGSVNKEAIGVRADETTISFKAGTDKSTSGSLTKDVITISMSTLGRDDNYRANSGSSITVSTSNGVIIKTVFTCAANETLKYGPGNMSGDNYSYSNKVGTWQLSTGATSISLKTSAQVRMTQIDVTYKTDSSIPLENIELKNYPTSPLEIGNKVSLSYYGMDSDANEWIGDVVYVSSDENVATIDESGVLTAFGAGTSNISVYANAGVDGAKVESTPITISVLADPDRVDLPIGTYQVNIDYSSVKKNDTVPASQTYDIKEKEGTGEDRIWYKNMSIAYSGVTAIFGEEYTFASDTSTATITNNSNAKITSVIIKYYDTKRLTLTDDSSNVISGAEDGNVVTYNLSSTVFTLKGQTSVTNTSIYSMQITFSVVDESEQLLNLVIAKSASWNKTSYKEKESPSSDGLIVTANYTTDGSSISRSIDVTSQVSTWSFTPSVLSLADTSFSVVAVWNGYTSVSLTIEGITVESISGALESGRYFISETGTLEVREYTNKTSTAVDITKTSAWDFELVADNTYNISTTIGDYKYYLYVANNSTGLRTSTTNAARWTLTALTGEDAGKYALVCNDGTQDRYLCNYNSTSTNDWRTYKSSNIGTMYKLSIVEEKDVFASNFLNTFTAGCNPNGGYDSAKMDWVGAKTQYNTLSYDNKNIFVNTIVNESSTDNISKCVNKYDYIVEKYGTALFENFMNRSGFSTSASNRIYKSSENDTAIMIITVVTLSSITVIGGYLFIRKRNHI